MSTKKMTVVERWRANEEERKRKPGMSKAKAIRLNCRECAGGTWGEVLCCHLMDCLLWPWRTGYSAKKNEESLKKYLEKHPDIEKELEEIMELRAEEAKEAN